MKALVTGASRGIGRALVRELVAAGHDVWGVARTRVALAELANELGSKFRYTVADLTSDEGIESVTAALNEAGYFPTKVYLVAGVYSTSDETFSTPQHCAIMIEGNYTSSVKLYNALINGARPPKCIVAISSIFALLSDPLNPAYATAKANLASFFIKANGAGGISTKVVYLGPVNTSINKYAKHAKSIMAVEPGEVAKFLRHLPKKSSVTFIYPLSSNIIYQILRYLPKSIYAAVMNKARR